MNVVVVINGREAVPVRAIPLLTNWETMSPDIVSRALAWDEDAMYFEGLQAFQFDDGQRAVPATWWENMARRQLKALSHAIKAVQITHETGLQEWRRKSLEVLPAGVFVWKDEFEPMHCRRYGPDGTTLLKNGAQLTEKEHARVVALDFDPFIPDKDMQGLVMEGFEPTTYSKGGADAAFVLGFYGVTLKSKIEHWAAMAEVQPLEAARLLCGEDPFNIQAYADSLEVKMLTRIFEDRARNHPACHALRDWALVAQQSGADHRQGISNAVVYLAANTVTTPQTAPMVKSGSTIPSTAPVVQATETKEQRQDRRLQACIDDGLPMNEKAALSRLPDGVGAVADLEGVTRQAFSTDVKAALQRRESAKRAGSAVHRA